MTDEIKINIEMNQERIDKQYWIDRLGKKYKYKGDLETMICSFHYEIAKNLFPHVENPQRYIEKLGWVAIGSKYSNRPFCELKLTQAQVNTLTDLGFKTGVII